MILEKIKSISISITASKSRRDRRRFLLGVLAIILSIALSVSCKDIIFNNPLDPDASKEVVAIVRVFDTLLGDRGDIAYDGEKFWKIDPSGNLTAFDRESGTIIRSFFNIGGTGVGFFKDSLWLCGTGSENILVIVDPLSGDTLNQISTRDLFPGFLAGTGGQLIIYDTRSAGIFDYDPDTGDAVRLFEIPGINVGGIALYKGGLLVSDMNTDSLYRFALNGSVIDVYSSPAAGIGGVGVDAGEFVYLFMLDGKVYKVSLP
ncbi:MAG: hypothetical protein GY940_20075 [bacterium]|nr:hypothetical protein [bacterium]